MVARGRAEETRPRQNCRDRILCWDQNQKSSLNLPHPPLQLQVYQKQGNSKMGGEDFNSEILTEKLSKLNNSQQSIESLSQWCVTHRKKAKQIVETWDKYFNSSQKGKRVSYLYLANDILQNSRRKGSEFVNEFWKVLPAALKHVYGNGDEHGKKAVIRLVDIWGERKVFGSRGHGLKDELLAIQKLDEALGKDPLPTPISNGKSSNPIKIVKKDAISLRIKLAVGGFPEKILTAFQSVFEESSAEDTALNKCINAALNMSKIREEAEHSLAQGNQHGVSLVGDVQDQENVLIQCIPQLEIAEAARTALVSQLKEALLDQESKLDVIHKQLQGAIDLAEHAGNLKKRLTASSSIPTNSSISPISFSDVPRLGEQNVSATAIQQNTAPASLPPLPQPTITSFPALKSIDEDSKKAAVMAMAAKLTASTSSAQMLTSVLSSLVAEEAAVSINGGMKRGGLSEGFPMFSPDKKPKLEKPMAVSEASTSSDTGSHYFTPQSMNNQPMPHPITAQANQMQASFGSPPPPPANPLNHPYVQSSDLIAMPYAYTSNPLPPPPPFPPQVPLPLTRPILQTPQQPQPEQPQQQPSSGGYYRPPGMGFFGQNHQSATSAVPRQ